jgi:signal transduction histidine kinase
MNTFVLLEQIRPAWLSRVTSRLARGEGVRQSFQAELERFYQQVQQVVVSGDNTWLDAQLESWSSSLTQTDLEDSKATVSLICNRIFLTTYELCREQLSAEEALQVIGDLLPIQEYAYSFATQREFDQQLRYLNQEVERNRAELEQLDKSKSDFIAVAAHELKTPLTLVEGYATMMRETLEQRGRPDQLSVLLDGIDGGSRRLRQIIDDMIDVSLIDNNLLRLTFQPLWLNRLLDILANEFATTTRQRRLMLNIQPFPGYDQMTYGDPERLYQAFYNIINNAIKYTPDGGRITIDGRELPGFVEVRVTDTGIGIAQENQLRIFEKFNRLGDIALHSSGKTKFKGGGPGLGLPISRGIIEAHGGALWVESEGYDETRCPGSTFHIIVPIRSEPPDDKIAKLFRALSEADTEA